LVAHILVEKIIIIDLTRNIQTEFPIQRRGFASERAADGARCKHVLRRHQQHLPCGHRNLREIRFDRVGDLRVIGTRAAGKRQFYDMLCRADAIGVFQVESRAQLNFMPKMRPRKFYDLVCEVAIVRPGPIQGGMVHPFINRRIGREKVEDLGPAMMEELGRTYGVPLFQEQAM